MSYKTTYRKDGGVLLDYSGNVSGKEALGADHKIYTSTAHPISEIRYLIVDFCDTKLIDYTASISRTADNVDRKVLADNPNLNIVVVAHDDLIFGFSRMWKTFVNQEARTEIFRTRDEAEAWVKTKLAEK